MGKKMLDIDNVRDTVMMSDAKVWGIMSEKKGTGKTFLTKLLCERLIELDKKVLCLTFGKVEADSLKEELSLLDKGEGESGDTASKNVAMGDIEEIDKIIYSDRFEQLMQEYREKYDYVLVDMLSFEESTIAKKLGSLCEKNIFVVSQDVENGETVGKRIQSLKQAGVNVYGIVINEYRTKKILLRM